jgi:RNA polymerase sigma-70 factor (ECF subfamily)
MAIFRRSNTPSGGSSPDIAGDAWADPRTERGSLAAPAAGAARAAAPAVPTDADLLPDLQTSDRERRREQRLVEAACRGEDSAIEALYRTHFDTIYRYVLLRLGSPAAAEDVTSQVFLGMIKGLGRYQDQGKPFVAWLYGIAQKQIAFYQRGQGRAPDPVDLEAATELVAQSAGPDATAEQREMRVAIARALSKVPDGQREVIMLRYILSLSVAETAAVVGRTEGAVKQLQLRGLATLKTILGQAGRELA